jgi:formylglycine-generating enzyme required for sulfatase activity
MSRWFCLSACTALAVATLFALAGPEERKEQILKRFVDEFLPVTPGTGKYPASFVMGSGEDAPAEERPAHKVTFRGPFAMAKFEVTQELWQAVMGNNPSKWKGPRNSVELISWDEANAFCRKVTQELRRRKLIEQNEVIRLPSEAEWEYVCRAGTTTAYSFGESAKELTHYAWFTGNAAGNDPPVGRKKPNPWGFYDMHGYVWEWCADAWHPNYEGAPADGSARQAKEAKERMMRGGSWRDKADECRSAFRGHQPPGTRSDAIGLRCVRAKEGGKDEK